MHFSILWYKAKEILRKKKEKEKSISRNRALAIGGSQEVLAF